MEDEKEQLPPDIHDYLETTDDNLPVDIRGNEELIYKIVASTGLDFESAKIITQSFFQELRNQTLRGNDIIIKSFGKLSISSPKRDTKKKVFIKFKPFKKLLRKINGD